MSTTAPYGSWKSPITTDLIVAETVGLGEIVLDGQDIYWLEGRSKEQGRNVIVRRTPDGERQDVTPPPFNVRTRVHEYGGGAYLVSEGVVYFSNFLDQRLYRQRPGEEPQPVTPDGDFRYADGVMDRVRNRIICVCEDHTLGEREPVNSLAGGDLDSGQIEVLVSGNDFYASPRLSPDGAQLAWLTWNHPNMPWNGTELWVAEVRPDGSLGARERVAGGLEESIFQPAWSPGGVLYFVSDRTGWWNLYRWGSAPSIGPEGGAEGKAESRAGAIPRGQAGQVEPLVEMEAEFGLPQWVFGMSTYGVESDRRIVCTFTREGAWHLASLDTHTKQLQDFEIDYTTLTGVRARRGGAAFLGGSPTEPVSVVVLDLEKGEGGPHIQVLRSSSNVAVDPGYLTVAQAVEFPTEGGASAHGLFYPPRNKDYTGPANERPPLLVISHGGPTGATSNAFNLAVQYWTSRGFAVLDVNYGGSTGYGRSYCERLNDRWGIVDVDDCVNGARFLVQQGLVDGDRLMIRGGSAGGYTTLAALTFRDVFRAGASYYGVSDLEALAQDTHKFESRYLDRLVGPYPERRELYRQRSPIHFADQLSCPVIFFQGLEDRVVPPSQAERMVEALKAKGVPVAYLAFEGEQHGFRQAGNIKRALDAELFFYSRIFGFELAEPVEPVPIENL